MKKIFSIIFLSLLFLLTFNSVQAGLVPCGPGTGKEVCELCDFFVMIENIIDFLLLPPPAGGGVVLALAVLMIAVGGFMYVIAYAGAGGPEMLSRAKSLFTAVAIGLLIIYSAFLIIGLFLKFIGLANWTESIYRDWIRGDFFEIQCESSSEGSPASGGGISPGGGGGTGTTTTIPGSTSTPPLMGKITNVSHEIKGDEIKIHVTFKNTATSPGDYDYAVYLKDANGKVIEAKGNWIQYDLDIGEEKTVTFSSHFDFSWDIDDLGGLGGEYTVELHEEDEGIVDSVTKSIGAEGSW